MYRETIGDDNGKQYEITVLRNGLVTVDEIVAHRRRTLLSTTTVTPSATFFPPAVGDRIVKCIAEGRHVLGLVAA